MLAQHLAQRPVQHVGAGVVAADGVAPGGVDDGVGLLAGGDGALDDAGGVPAQAREGERRVDDLGAPGRGGDRAGVADLAARLGVEGRPVEEDLDRPVGGGDHRQHAPAGGGVVGVAGELRGAELLDELAVRIDSVVVDTFGLAGLLGPAALLGHLGVEAGDVDGDAALVGDLLGELEREPVRGNERVGSEVADEHVGRREQLLQCARSSGSRRSSTTLRLPRLSRANAGFGMSSPMPSEPNTLRIGSPAGGSTLMTSAPQSASSAAADGAATHTPSSTTRRSANDERPCARRRSRRRPGASPGDPLPQASFTTLPVALSGSSSTISTLRGTL